MCHPHHHYIPLKSFFTFCAGLRNFNSYHSIYG
jgi:hypothetical protein